MDENAQALSGCRIVVTRATAQSAALTAALQAHGATVIACPVIEIGPPASWADLDRTLTEMASYDWLVFTSRNGVAFFLQRWRELGGGLTQLAHLRIGAVGPGTAEHLAQAGLTVTLLPQEFSAQGFAAAFLERYGRSAKNWRMLVPISSLASDVWCSALKAAGVHVELVTVYENRLPELSRAEVLKKLCEPPAQFLLFSSPSTVNNLARLIAPTGLSELPSQTRIVCLGPVTAAAAGAHGLAALLQPEAASTAALLKLLLRAAAQLQGCSAAM